MAETIIVTQNEAMVEYVQERHLAPANAKVLPHADPEEIRRQHVIGTLPLHLAALAASVTEVPLGVPPDHMNRALTLYDIRQFAGPPRRYRVLEMSDDLAEHWFALAGRWDGGQSRGQVTRTLEEALDFLRSLIRDANTYGVLERKHYVECLHPELCGGYSYALVEPCSCGRTSETCKQLPA